MPDAGSATSRALEHLRLQAVRRAAEVVEGPPGLIAVFDPAWPVSHLSNRALVTASLDPSTGTDDVLAFVDASFAGRGLAHRKVDVLDDTLGRRFRDELMHAGYGADPVLVMVAGANTTATQPTTDGPVVEILDEASVRELVAKAWRVEENSFTPETIRQLVERRDALDRAATVIRLGVREAEAGSVVAKADVLVIDDVAEIDDVLTLPDHRGRGYASALVRAGVAQARAVGATLVYLQAAEDDWPQHLYARLGFSTVTTIHEHTSSAP